MQWAVFEGFSTQVPNGQTVASKKVNLAAVKRMRLAGRDLVAEFDRRFFII